MSALSFGPNGAARMLTKAMDDVAATPFELPREFCPKLRAARAASTRAECGANEECARAKDRLKTLTECFADACNLADGPASEETVQRTVSAFGPTFLRGTTDLGEFRGFVGGGWFSSGEVYMTTYFHKSLAYAVPLEARKYHNTSSTVKKSVGYLIEFDTESLARAGTFRPGPSHQSLTEALGETFPKGLDAYVDVDSEMKPWAPSGDQSDHWTDEDFLLEELRRTTDPVEKLNFRRLVETTKMFAKADGEQHVRLPTIMSMFPGGVGTTRIGKKRFENAVRDILTDDFARLYACYKSLIETSELRWIPFNADDVRAYQSCVRSVRLLMYDLVPKMNIQGFEYHLLPAMCPSFTWERSTPDDATLDLEDVAAAMGASKDSLERRRAEFVYDMKDIFLDRRTKPRSPRGRD